MYFDELDAAARSAYARRILTSAQTPESSFSGHALRYLAGAGLASLAALAYDYLLDFSVGFSRPEERTFVGFLAVFVALWGGLGLLGEAALRAAKRRCAYEITELVLPHIQPPKNPR